MKDDCEALRVLSMHHAGTPWQAMLLRAARMIEDAASRRWISVEDALPDKDGRYLVRFRKYHKGTEIALRVRGEWWVSSEPERPDLLVAYWQPLPAPPVEEE